MVTGEPVTFLLTDLVGSTELWDEEPDAMSVALVRHDQLVAETVAEHGGTLVKTKGEGDSTFSVFARAANAAKSALALRTALAREPWPTSRPLVTRIGVTTGSAEERGGDWFGPAVIRAARLRSLAPPGAILLSGIAAEEVGPLTGAELVALGSHRLRGLRDPEAVVALVETGEPRPVLRELGRAGDAVPAPLNSTFGRSDDITALVVLLDRARLVTLVGAGGSGKTRLAVEVALAASRFDHASMVELAPVDDGAAAVDLVRAAVAVADGLVAPMSVLVVVDNCEHVVDEIASALPGMLAERHGVSVLATSRVPLRLSVETIYPVAPLRGPTVGASLSQIAETPAGALFLDRARRCDARLDPAPGDAVLLERCLAALDGLPLAIEIAASQVGVSGLAPLAEALEARLPALRIDRIDVDERHRSMAATIDWGVGLLAPRDRDALISLSVCRGFDLDLAASVTRLTAATEVVDRLVDSSLVVATGGGRFRLLEPVRQHCERLVPPDELAPARDALATAMVSRSRRLLRTIYTDPAARLVVALDRGNLEQSLGWLERNGRADEAATLIGLTGVVWFSTDQDTGRRWCERLRSLIETAAPAIAAPARVADAMVHQGTPIARAQLERALIDSNAAGRRRTTSLAAFWLAREMAMAEHEWGVEAVRAAFLQAKVYAGEAHDVVAAAWCSNWLALLAMRSGDLDAAERGFRDAIEQSRSSAIVHPLPEAIMGVAIVRAARGDLGEAARLADRSIAAGRRINDPWQLLGQLLDGADIAGRAGDLTRAAMVVVEAGALALEVGDEYRIAEALAVVRDVRAALGVDDPVDREADLALWTWVQDRRYPARSRFGRFLQPPGDDLDLLVGPVPRLADALRTLLDVMSSEPKVGGSGLDRPA